MTTKAPDYRYLTVSEKQRRERESMREPPQVCPCCETATTPTDMPRHLEACPGPREPHDRAKWVPRAEVLAMGLSKRTLARWVSRGQVRTRIRARVEQSRGPGRPAFRTYHLRDVTGMMALRRRIRCNELHLIANEGDGT